MLHVPPLDSMRALDTAELVRLRSDLTDAAHRVDDSLRENKIEHPFDTEEEYEQWRRRALSAKSHFTRGIANIRSVFAERDALRFRQVHDDLYDAVKNYIETDVNGDDEAMFDALIEAFNAVPVPYRHRKQEAS